MYLKIKQYAKHLSIFKEMATFTEYLFLNKIKVGMSTYMKKAVPIISAAIILWAILAFASKSFLFKTCDLSLFLFDWTFLKEAFTIPGGFLGWVGSFFTQFLYIPWFGALLWVSLLVLAGFLTIRIFGLPEKFAGLAVIPVALLIIANMSLGYGIFIMRSQDYFFAPTLGYLLMLAIMAATWKAPKLWQRISILAISAFAGYILAGVFALAGTVAAGIGLASEPIKSGRTEAPTGALRITVPIVSVILCIVTPFILYGLFTRYRLADSWYMGLPSISDDEWTVWIRLPLWILMTYSIAMASLCSLFANTVGNGKHPNVANAVVIALSVAATVLFWFKDENFRTELEMSIAADNYDWKKISDIYFKASIRHIDKEKKAYETRQKELAGVKDKDVYENILDEYDDSFFEPTRLMVMLRDLAFIKQDKALDQAFALRDGAHPQKSRTQIPMVFQAGRQLYLNYGLTNLEYRWCLEDQVEHGWCFGTLKYMAMYAIIMNETEFATRYLDKLDKTLFFRDWSKKQRILSGNRDAISDTAPYKDILPLMCFNDRMSNDRVKIETYLMSHFANDRDVQSTHQFDKVALFWAMRSQNIELFWKALSQYIDTADELQFPQNVQEAILLYSSLEKDDMGIPIDESVTDSYESFQKYTMNSSFRSEKEASFPMWLNFGKTFYYYYYFVRGLKTF